MPTYLDRVLARERAARHARSIPLGAVTLALGVLTVLDHDGWPDPWLVLAVPAATFLLVLVAVAVQRSVHGAGGGRDGYGLVAGLLALLVVTPMAVLVPMFVGAEPLLGLGLVVLGWRGRDRGLWVPGLVLVAVGPFVHLNGAANTLFWLPVDPVLLVQVATTLAFAGLALAAASDERHAAARAPAADLG